ncbi:hypothetical protein MKW98_016374 [Papaver atlanticum]|uniref:F-box/LRR-repeat protein 15-like leucin rich repeat domain-containing protein n=1 Tax=Papaver atlanticum TaxID=357466 RepID=A0AAD4RVY0_9MAGN|nr:hypothetical protein MKW98_016374 [Papaver atlanticum]
MTITTRSGKEINPPPNLSPKPPKSLIKTPNLSPSTPNKTQEKSPKSVQSTPLRRSSRLSLSTPNTEQKGEENRQEIRVSEKVIRVFDKEEENQEIKGFGSVKRKKKSTGVEGDDELKKKKKKKQKKGFEGLGNLGSGSGGSGSLRRSKRLMKNDDESEDVKKKEMEFDLNCVPLSSGSDDSVDESEGEEEERKWVIDIDSSSELEEGLDLNLGGLDVEYGNIDVVEMAGSSAAVVDEYGRKYSAKEKGKGKLSMQGGSWLSMNVEADMMPEEGETDVGMLPEEEGNDATVDEEEGLNLLGEFEEKVREFEEKERSIKLVRLRARMRKDRKRWVKERATASASRFARVQREDEVDDEQRVAGNENEGVAEPAIDQEVEDWPGPFSTAMRIIKQREKGNVPSRTWAASEKEPDVEWEGATDPERKRVTPKLEDMSMNLLAKHVEALSSLRGVPDVLRNKLSNVLCDSRKMDSHFMELLTSGSPTEIRVKDGSWLTEEEFSKIMKGCDTSNLTVLQLDLCGHCLPDYALRPVLAQSPNSLPALSSISLRGACRLTDGGIKSLVASAPSLCSVNLAACPLLSSTSIMYMADALGSVLKELYLDDCQNIDMMLSLPAIQKLEFLEVLSLADIETVSDDFVSNFVTVCGRNLKELDFSGCSKLTDRSLKAVGEKCSALQTLHLANLLKLTDSSLGYLANGCRSIQTLKLRGNAFSDLAVAAFLEASGEPLTEFSLNKVKKVGRHTAISLARCCSKNLLSLDVSWCRSLTDSALGLIVDSCKKLKIVKVFGCTQITSKFVNGHSNACVQIVGLQLTPILEHLNILGHQEATLRYSSVPVRTES